MDKCELPIRFGDGAVVTASLSFSTQAPWRLALESERVSVGPCEGTDLFDALLALRTDLEREGAMLLCKGAYENVWPSGMTRSMFGGRKAYSLELGVRPSKHDLVDIFGPAVADCVVTPEKQRHFWESWLESVR